MPFHVNAMLNTTGTPTETSLENIRSLFLYYFTIIPTRSACSIFLGRQFLGTAFNLRQGIKTLPSCAHVLHKNLEFGHFTLIVVFPRTAKNWTARALYILVIKMLLLCVLVAVAIVAA